MAIYYHRIPGSVIRIMVERHGAKVCEDVCFPADGKLNTEDLTDPITRKAVEAYLEPIANRPGSNVSTTSQDEIEEAVNAMRIAEMRKLAETAQTKLIAGGERP